MSLRSRIRGGQDYLTDRVATAAQFLTLRLAISVATEDICGDSEGPGHAPTLPLCWAITMETNTIFWIIAALVGVVAVILIGQGILDTITNFRAPLRSSPAKVVSRRTDVSGNSDGPVSTTYYVTFQFHDGSRTEISVSGYEYGIICEGDVGELKYKGTWFKGFHRI